MATDQERLESTEQAFARQAERGNRWPSARDLALDAMRHSVGRRREQRSKLFNCVLDMMALDGRPSKPSFRYNHQTALSLIDLRGSGRVDERFLDDQGRLRRNPPIPRSSEDKRYRLITEETKPTPQDRFEAVAARIEDLPDATGTDEAGAAVTSVSAEIGTPQNPTWPRPLAVQLAVDYLPSGPGPARDPNSIRAAWSIPIADGSTEVREAQLSLADVGTDAAGGRTLEALENTVRAVELTQAGGDPGSISELAGRAIVAVRTEAEGPETMEYEAASQPASPPLM